MDRHQPRSTHLDGVRRPEPARRASCIRLTRSSRPANSVREAPFNGSLPLLQKAAVLEFRILGPLEVLADGAPVTLSGRNQRALLTLLLLRANEPVSTERLVDQPWGASPPRTATTSLQNAVSQL